MKRPNLKDTASVWLEYVLALEAKVERLEREREVDIQLLSRANAVLKKLEEGREP